MRTKIEGKIRKNYWNFEEKGGKWNSYPPWTVRQGAPLITQHIIIHFISREMSCQGWYFNPTSAVHRIMFTVIIKEFKRGIGSLFDPCVNAMGRRPYCPSRMEVSYCTFGFGTIILRDLRTLSLPHDSPHGNQYACVIWVLAGKVNSCLTELFGGLSYEKIWRYNNSAPYVTARWLPQQIPPLNFFGYYYLCVKSNNIILVMFCWKKKITWGDKLYEHKSAAKYTTCLQISRAKEFWKMGNLLSSFLSFWKI